MTARSSGGRRRPRAQADREMSACDDCLRRPRTPRRTGDERL
jgi:hypothetical protein